MLFIIYYLLYFLLFIIFYFLFFLPFRKVPEYISYRRIHYKDFVL